VLLSSFKKWRDVNSLQFSEIINKIMGIIEINAPTYIIPQCMTDIFVGLAEE